MVTEEWLQDERERFRERLPSSGFWSFDRVIADRMNQPYFKRAIDKRGYIHGQLENAADRWGQEKVNGRTVGTGANAHRGGSNPQDDPELHRLRALGVIHE